MATITYQYNQIEAALVAAFNISDGERPAFKGRLRHLRKRGVPDLPATGRGGISTYSERDLIELVWAVEMEAMGVSPGKIPTIIENSRSDLPATFGIMSARSSRGGDWWFVVVPNSIVGDWNKAGFAAEKDLDGVMRDMRTKWGRVSAGNISARLQAAFEAIAGTQPAKRGP
ncbi:MAG: hypothetical protein O7I42_13515 [Alphaproteobacteria bacterium]|nr:hypothetical protein [Alphaproteobacteria bacterium]